MKSGRQTHAPQAEKDALIRPQELGTNLSRTRGFPPCQQLWRRIKNPLLAALPYGLQCVVVVAT